MSHAKRNIPSDSTKATLEVCLRPELHCLPAVCNNDGTAYRELHFTMPLADLPLRGIAQTPCRRMTNTIFGKLSFKKYTYSYVDAERKPNRHAVWTCFESLKKLESSHQSSRSFVSPIKSFSYALQAEIIFIHEKTERIDC